MKLIIKSGEKYGYITIIEEGVPIKLSNGYFSRTSICKCICGKISLFRMNDLRTGHTTSCGCMTSELLRKANTTHGLAGTLEYNIWQGMIKRCINTKSKFYFNYGGRGITICEKWMTFEGFWEDMKGGYIKGLQLDRIDNNGNYKKDNCRWTTRKIQMRNTRANVLLTHNGKTQCVAAWAEETGIKYKTLHMRVTKYKWPAERALTTNLTKV